MLDVATEPRWSPDAIRTLRKRLRLRQEEFAEMLGYDRRQSVSDLETGTSRPSGSVEVLLDLIDSHDGLPSRKG